MGTDLGTELLDELVLGSARGGKRPAAPLSIEVVRALDEADIPLLLAPPPVRADAPSIRQIRHSHHLLAQTLAKGFSQSEASLITGYSPSYISILVNSDPAFRELMGNYSAEREAVFVDTVQRLKALGLTALEELQARLEESGGDWSKRELMDFARMCLIDPMKGQGAAQPSGNGTGGVQVNISFPSPPASPRPGFIDLNSEESSK